MLEVCNLLVGESIGLGDDRNEIDFGVESTHDLNIQGLERVAGGLDEVDTSVHTIVNDVHAVHLVLGIEIRIEPLLDVLDNRTPRVVIVDEVAKARSVHHSQAETNAILLNIGRDGLYADGLGGEVKRGLLALLWRVKRGVEQSVDESGFAQARLTWREVSTASPTQDRLVLTNDHNVEVEAFAHTLAVPLVGQVGEANVAGELPAHDVPHVARRSSRRLGVFRGHGLRSCSIAIRHGITCGDQRRGRLAIR